MPDPIHARAANDTAPQNIITVTNLNDSAAGSLRQALADGGPTFTHQLLTGSPAIDAGDLNFTPPPYYDQRGPDFWRERNGRIDVGSFEVQAGSTPTPTPTATPTPTPRTNPTPRSRQAPRPRP